MASYNARERIRIAFVLGELTVGGAEMMLWKLVSRIDRACFEPFVIALSPRTDVMLDRFEASGTQCIVLGMKSRNDARALVRLRRLVRKLAPDLVQGWMYYGNLAVTFASMLMGRRAPAVLWSIRGTLNLSQEKRLSVLSIWLGGKLSSLPRRVINNSIVSAFEHERFGYRSDNRVIVPNGFDTEAFQPCESARRIVREMLCIPPEGLVIGLFGRYHPMKDHENFIQAAALLSLKYPDAHYVLAGENIDTANRDLEALIARSGLGNRAHLLGVRNDMESITAALDIAASSSSAGEGFSNVVGEAMSCGVPCVATDVGDAASIIGPTGRVVTARNPRAMASAFAELVELGEAGRRELGARARDRIIERFSLDTVVRQYEQLYKAVYAEHRA